MHHRLWTSLVFRGLLTCGLVWLAARPAAAEERAAASLLPPTTVGYVEIPSLSDSLGVILDHPLRARIEEMDEYRAATSTKEYVAFQGIVQYVESRLGMSWREAITALTEQGVTVGFDASSEGLVVLLHARNEETLTKLIDAGMALAREDAKNKGESDPYSEDEYRGVTVHRTKDGAFALVGEWLVIVNKGDAGKAVLDRLLDGKGESLAENPRFQASQKTRPADAALWGWVDVGVIRQAQADKGQPFQTQAENPVGELLVGGLLDTLQHAPWGTFALTLNDQAVSLGFQLPHEQAWVTESRHYFFGADGTGRAPAAPAVDGLLFRLATYRDLSEMWLRAGDLFPEAIVDKFAEADSNLTTLFSGKDFGEDVLGSFGPQMQILVARQTFAEGTPTPSIKIPASAVQFQMRDPATTTPELRRTFQSLIGFLNVVGAMNGQPQLEMDMAKETGYELVVGRYIAPKAGDAEGYAKIHYNFSPTVAFAGDRFILASTEAFARELAAAPSAPEDSAEPNTVMHMDAAVLRQVLDDNRSHLVSQNMLEKGHGRDEAEREIDLLLKALAVLRETSTVLSTDNGRVELKFEWRLNEVLSE
jgi:hypothetical protein